MGRGSCLGIVSQGGIMQGKMFGGKSPRVNCPGVEGWDFMRVNCLGVTVPDGKYSGAKVRGRFHRGQLLWGSCSGGNYSG